MEEPEQPIFISALQHYACCPRLFIGRSVWSRTPFNVIIQALILRNFLKKQQGVIQMKNDMTLFEDYQIRRVYDENTEIWWLSVVDIVQVLIQQADYQTTRKYWNKLKQRLTKEGSQSVTNCHRLKLIAADGKKYLTDVATAETLLRLVQPIPSPKAEPINLWLAR